MRIAIIFIGLIVQVNQPMSFDNTAVLIGAAEHQPRLVIPWQSVMNPDDPWLSKQPRVGSDVEIDLTGATVRVKGTRGVFSDLKDTFTDGSPSLRRISPGCELRDEVKNRQIVPGELAAYVDFRGGEVMPESYLPKKIIFTGKEKNSHCAVCRARYEADLRGDHAILIYKKKVQIPDCKTPPCETEEKHEIQVAGGPRNAIPEIRVSNRSSSSMARHFTKAYNIYVGKCASSQKSPTVTPDKCDEPKKCPTMSSLGTVWGAEDADDCTVDRHP